MIVPILSLIGLRTSYAAVPPKPDESRSPRWPAARKAHLKRFPTCAATGMASDLDVHHIRPFHEHPELELDPDNLITLTRTAHFCLGHFCDWRLSDPDIRQHAAEYLARRASRHR